MNHVNYEICRRLGTPKKYTPPRLGNKGEITGHVATVRTLRIRSNSARLHASAWRETGWKPFSNGFFIFFFFLFLIVHRGQVRWQASVAARNPTSHAERTDTNKNVSTPTSRRKMSFRSREYIRTAVRSKPASRTICQDGSSPPKWVHGLTANALACVRKESEETTGTSADPNVVRATRFRERGVLAVLRTANSG